ncbi:MAG: alanine--tRNA ligase [Acidimicrobiaceae bacterium TMED77]|nr:alanine--tRNA ligase [Acidimicrobiales bacterium]OUU99819.1 MAG: alanine--tRNA ligase [Acidimicrobiaceae bacterium TMED77]|tara:strand:- start:189 stop:2759 length:2571 start_codon:yes stop_codon:yes gene_type:complete
MKARELRTAFTSFFEERGHQIVPSSSLIPHDETILFTNAGMVPFKNYFLGLEKPGFKRATTVQKCVRAGGKHNDLDEVGRTSRHLTFFEMMGNFSFGDYFKEDAIPLAWEFFTEVLRLDSERLWVTVHHSDDEAAEIWENVVGVSPTRIQRLDEDNWWRMADTGPNGPCSEIFWDKGEEYGPEGGPANPEADERYVEIWNLVFMQFDQQTDGTQTPLPRPSIDTGAGLERVLSVIQGVDAVWETDEFQTLLQATQRILAIKDTEDPSTLISLQIIADHARSTTFLTNDGVIPSNEDRGYVLRRIVRRAVRHAHLLGVETPVMSELVDEVIVLMSDAYPELKENEKLIKDILNREEEGFRNTLSSGIKILDSELQGLSAEEALPGDIAFQLHDTFGFPMELTQEIAAERGIEIDLAGFEKAMQEQRDRAKADSVTKDGLKKADIDLQGHVDLSIATDFMGYETFETKATVLFADSQVVILDKTPFYAESGGQIGDSGKIVGSSGSVLISDTNAVPSGQYMHLVESMQGELVIGETVRASIDIEKRLAIQRHHTATHLLHWALREVLGDHVKQQGSWVGSERLRFDFSHFEALTAKQIIEIEDLVNEEIFSSSSVEVIETEMTHAKELGAIAFFGDKYGEVVRVLKAGGNSIELCGGTHVSHLSEIGPVKVLSEGSIGSNIRRIEAVAGLGSFNVIRDQEAVLQQIGETLGVPVSNIIEGLDKKIREIEDLKEEIQIMRNAFIMNEAEKLVDNVIDGVISQRIEGIGREELKQLTLHLRDSKQVEAVILGTVLNGGGVAIAAAVSKESSNNAADLIAEAAKLIKGGGGKGKDFAMAGGKDSEALDEALRVAREAAVKS